MLITGRRVETSGSNDYTETRRTKEDVREL